MMLLKLELHCDYLSARLRQRIEKTAPLLKIVLGRSRLVFLGYRRGKGLLHLKCIWSIVNLKYPFHTESKPITGEEARKLIEAIEAGQAVTNERALALTKRIADCRHQSQVNAQSKQMSTVKYINRMRR